jgi:hypothetical protein
MAFLRRFLLLLLLLLLVVINSVRSQASDWSSFKFNSVTGSFTDSTFTFTYRHANLFASPVAFAKAVVREPINCGSTSDPALKIKGTSHNATMLTVVVGIDWPALARQSVFWTASGGGINATQGIIRFCVTTSVGVQETLVLNEDTTRYTQLVDVTSGFGDGASGLVPVESDLTFAPAVNPTVSSSTAAAGSESRGGGAPDDGSYRWRPTADYREQSAAGRSQYNSGR